MKFTKLAAEHDEILLCLEDGVPLDNEESAFVLKTLKDLDEECKTLKDKDPVYLTKEQIAFLACVLGAMSPYSAKTMVERESWPFPAGQDGEEESYEQAVQLMDELYKKLRDIIPYSEEKKYLKWKK